MPNYSRHSSWPESSAATLFRDKDFKAVEKQIDDLLKQLTPEEKVGQMIQAELASVSPDDVKHHSIGSVLNGGGVFPSENKHASVSDWYALSKELHLAADQSSAGIPLLWGTDAVHGHNNVLGATIFPHNIGLGAANDPELVEQIGHLTAEDVTTTGIDWVFAPNLAVARDYRWGRTFESFSENPEIVVSCGTALARGLQGNVNDIGFVDGKHVLATSKHFIGEGGTSQGIDQGDADCSEESLIGIHGQGHFALLQQGIPVVMAAFNSWRQAKVHGSHYLLTQTLKKRMGFSGPVVSDWDGFRQLDGDLGAACAKSINAGVDILMVSADWLGALEGVLAAVQDGQISMERIDDAVRRILRLKAVKHMLVPVKEESSNIHPLPRTTLHSEDRVALARKAVRKSIVLLKNNRQTLPISRDKRVLVVGSAAKNIAQQCGGWTLTWQGTNNQNHDFPEAQSLLDGIRAAFETTTGSVEFTETVDDSVEADVAMVVFGEQPYAEGEGDLNHLSFSSSDGYPHYAMQLLKQAGIPVVAVFLTGRPLWINPELNVADAFVVAWLPGTQAGAMAEVLLESKRGEQQMDFVGKLSFSWPQRSDQCSVNYDEPDEEPLFPLGYGLNYRESVSDLAEVDEMDTTEGPALRGPKYQGSYNYPK